MVALSIIVTIVASVLMLRVALFMKSLIERDSK